MRLRDLIRRSWGVSMDYRIGKLSMSPATSMGSGEDLVESGI
jgi:hypothetical protein